MADIPSHGVNDWFYREVTLDQVLADVQPIESLEDLAIEGLTADEAAAFLRSITE